MSHGAKIGIIFETAKNSDKKLWLFANYANFPLNVINYRIKVVSLHQSCIVMTKKSAHGVRTPCALGVNSEG